MLDSLISAVSNFILTTTDSWGYFGILLLMILESANIPIPSEIIMPFSGFLVSIGKLNFLAVVIVGAAGNLIGSLLSYFLAYVYGEKGINFVMKLFFSHPAHLETAKRWFVKFGPLSAFIGRFLPVIRTFISFPAGMFRVNLAIFSGLTFVGSFIWSLMLTFVGYVLSANWNVLEPYFRSFDILIIAVLFLGAVYIFRKRSGKL